MTDGEVNSPEGIERRHIHEARHSVFERWPLGLIGLGVLLVGSVFGAFGTEATRGAAEGGVRLSVDGPERIRNGELFEMRITVEAETDIDELTLLIGDEVWRDLTINTVVPAATTEGYRQGAFSFEYGALGAGRQLTVKVDGQVNPDHDPGVAEGSIGVADGSAALVSVDYELTVLP